MDVNAIFAMFCIFVAPLWRLVDRTAGQQRAPSRSSRGAP
jgi:hypothetical protein